MQKGSIYSEYRRELKKRILDCAVDKFFTLGIRAVKMDDIAKALGISKRTLYEIYSDKEQLLVDGFKYQFEISEGRLVEAQKNSNNVIELLVAFYNIHMVEMSKFNPVVYMDVEKYPKAKDFLEKHARTRDGVALEFFQCGISEGYFRDDIDYRIMLDILSLSTRAILTEQLFNKYPLQHLFHNIMIIYLRGLCTLKGVTLLDELMHNKWITSN